MPSPKQTLFLVVTFTCLMLSASRPFAQERRVALVIGNSNYAYLPALRNPVRDAQTLSDALATLGFTVYLANDLTSSEMKTALTIYSDKVANADVSLIYYAGHSANVNDQSLIFPIDLDPANPQSLEQLISLSHLTHLGQDQLRTNIILFDACQEPVALPAAWDRATHTRDGLKSPPINTIISFASAAGHAAHDGTGNHSLFAGALLDNIATPDINIEQTLRHVRRDVIRNSQGAQVPQTSSSLVTDFFFYPTHANYESMQNLLLQNGFANKPLLSEISQGVSAPNRIESALTPEQSALRDALCSKLAPPRPKICTP